MANIEQKFIDRIEDLRHNTYSRITNLQKELCPMVKEIYLNYQFYYWYDGYRHNLWEDDTHVYACNELPWCYDNELKNTTFYDTLDNLIMQEKMWPFLMFINGEAIKWSEILIIHDYDYTYMRVNNYVPDYSYSADIVVFPLTANKIRYGEDTNVLTGANIKGFYFNAAGKRIENTDFDVTTIRFEILDDNVYYKEVYLGDHIAEDLEFELPDGYVPTINNIIYWDENNLFKNKGAEENITDPYKSAYNLLRVNKDAKGCAILMYNMKDTTKMESYLYSKAEDLDRDSTKTYITQSISQYTDEEGKAIANSLTTPFDFDHTRHLTYDENIDNSIKYITNYDFSLWKDAYLDGLPIQSLTYTGEEFKNLSDNNGYIHFSRKHKDYIQDVAMVFVNSKLYEYSMDINLANNSINIPIFGIMNEDHVEVVLFNRCINNILDIVVPDNKTNVYIHPEYNLEDCYIMSDTIIDSVYSVPDSEEGRRQYIIEHTYTNEGNGNYKITFPHSFYYNRTLKIVPKRQFRYYRYRQKEKQFRLILPTTFNYCHDPDRYMVFVNGTKIDKTEYTITIPNKARPFDKLVLYISTILEEGDWVDIFYVPELLEEKYKKTEMTKDGYLELEETDNYPKCYPLSKYTTFLFINGRKVNPLDIKDIDLNKMLINVDPYERDEKGNIIVTGDGRQVEADYSIDSIYNITYMEFIEDNKYIAGYLQGIYDQLKGAAYDPDKLDYTVTAKDDWKVIIEKVLAKYGKSTYKAALEKLYGTINSMAASAASYKENYAGLKSALYDVIIDYYMVRSEAHTGEQFVMDFERAYWDPNVTIDAEDVVKIITLFPDKDKLLDYITTDLIAAEADVEDGHKFIGIT